MKRSKHIFIVFVFLLSNTAIFAQPTWQWSSAINSNQEEKVLDIATNPSNGETYACGFFDGNLSAIFTFGLNGTPDFSTPKGIRDGFVSKYDVAGNVIWAFKIGGPGATVEIEAITYAPNGNIYITGEFFGGMVEFQGVTSSIMTSQTPTGATKDMFLAAYNPNGELLWATRSTDTGNSIGFGIDADANGIYVAGRFAGDITFPPLAPVTWSGAASFFDGYIAKFDYSGNAIRVKTIFNTSSDGHLKAFNVATDGTDVFVVGTSGAVNWSFGPTGVNPTDINNGSAGTEDIWIISIKENNFNLNWSQVIGSVEDDEAKGLDVDVGGVYLTGGLGGASISFPGVAPVASIGTAKDIFSAKLFKTGLTDWVNIEQNNTAVDSYGSEVVSDGAGNLYITGSHNDTTRFNGGLNNVPSLGGTDVFVMNRKDGGTFMWAASAGSTGNDEGFGIGYTTTGDVYNGGSYDLTGVFGTKGTISDLQNNGYVGKLSVCTTTITCPVDQVVIANPTCQYTLLDYTGLAGTVASCGIASVKQLPIPGTVVNSGINPVTLFLTDLNGNIDTCSFNVIVKSAVNPTVVSCGTVLLGETTNGSVNNVSSFSCSGTPTPGEDKYYQITVPNGNYLLGVKITNASDVNDSVLSAFWVGGACPIGGGCISADNFNIASQTFTSNGQNQLVFSAVGPGTYYFVVDSETDRIDTYDIEFSCIVSGIEFDETNCGLDTDNDGLYTTINGSPSLTVNTCQSVTVCNTIYTQNILGGEWMDTVIMNLGPCYTNITNLIPTLPGPNGVYDGGGTWTPTYNAPTNQIEWGFTNSTVSTWGDGFGGIGYSCRSFTFCFDADISSNCQNSTDLNIDILIEDDGVNGVSSTTAPGFDYAVVSGISVVNSFPTITCPGNINTNVDAGTCRAIVSGLTPVRNDNCPNPFVTYSLTGATTGNGLNDVSGLSFNVGTTTVEYIISDSLGLKDTCSFMVTVIDNINPVISCPANVSIPCPAIVSSIAPTATGDNCGIDSVNYVLTGATLGNGLNDASGIFFNEGVTTVTYTVTDLSGNITSCNFTITVTDVVNPTITCPGSKNIPCPAIVNGIAPIATGDNCGIDSVSYVLTGATTGSGLNDASGTAFNSGVTTVTYTVTDLSGNIMSCNFTITVTDVVNPIITCSGNVSANNDAGICGAVVNGITPIATGDNCGIDSVSYVLTGATIGSGLNDASGTAFNSGVSTITYTVTDLSGNTSSCNFTIIVTDTTNPAITCPGNVNVNNDAGVCGAVVNGIAPLATGDNCGIDSVNYVLTGATTGRGLIDASGIFFNQGVTTVTYTITDLSGNTSSCNFTITVNDTEPPALNCPANSNVYVDGSCNFTIPDYRGAISGLADNCTPTGSIVITQLPTIGAIVSGAVTSQVITIYAADASGNIDSCLFSINLIDTIKPIISCPGNINVSSDLGSCGAIVNGISPTIFNDNCSIDSVSYTMFGATNTSGLNDASGVFFYKGTTNVTYMITDVSGNIEICGFSVIVADNEAPTITCPPNITVNNDVGNCDAIVNGIAPSSVNDNCAIDSVSYSFSGATTGSGLNDASGTLFNVGTTTVTYMVTDSAGNTAGCNFTVIVNDTEAPSFSCPPNTNEYVDINCGFNVPDYTASILGLTDNCTASSSIILTQSPLIGTVISGHGTSQNITIYAADISGNIDSCIFVITLQDTIKPTIICPGNTVEIVDNNCSVTVPNYSATSVTDNCASTISVSQLPLAGTIITTDTTIVLTANDGNGNTDTCSFILFVNDTVSPVVICPNDTIINNDAGTCDAVVTFGTPINSDNCSVMSLINDYNGTNNSSATYPKGVTSVTWIATDNYSNAGTCSFNVTIIDAEAPVITCLSDTIINADNNSCDAIFYFNVSAVDNCSFIISQLSGLPSGSTFPIGETINSFMATDSAGLSDTCSFKITVVDTQNPTIICPSNIVLCDSSLIIPFPTTSDNCMIGVVINDFNSTNNASDIYPTGITTVNWTVTDTSGNSATCPMTIQVDALPTIANAGEDQYLLLNQNTNFEANTAIIGDGNWLLMSGSGSIDNNIDPLSFLSDLVLGDNIFRWTIVNGTCPDSFDEVNIIVGGLEVPSGFSPNGDGSNDLFVIPGLDQMNNEVVIFNRWGVEVFSAANYQNDWDGISKDGKTLPEDTYFYTIKLSDFGEDYSGYVVIKR